jgi:hypothetical protein
MMVNLIPTYEYFLSVSDSEKYEGEFETIASYANILYSQFGDGVHSVMLLQKIKKSAGDIIVTWIYDKINQKAKGILFLNGKNTCNWEFCTKTNTQYGSKKNRNLNEEEEDYLIGFLNTSRKILYDFAEGYGSKECDKVQKNRAKKSLANSNQKLGDDYYILTPQKIRPSILLGETSGTHASPRYHMARGHWRHYKDGRKSWIKAHWKGDKEKGTIYKDYAIAG